MQEIDDLITKLIEEAINYGSARERGDSQNRFACANTLDTAREELVKAIQEKLSCKSS